jgi:sugar phosphate isomerase/epimerase
VTEPETWPRDAALIASSWMAEGQRPSAEAGPCPVPLDRRLAAAVGAGFKGIGINRADYEALVGEHGVAGLAAILRDSGINMVELETLTGWWHEDPTGDIWRRPLDHMLELPPLFPVHQIKINGDFTDKSPMHETMREGFARLADRAASAGTVVGLEPVAFSNVRDAATARKIVAMSTDKGGGVVLDNWHFARGGLPPEDIGGLCAEGISGVEFSNVKPEIVGSLFEDTVDHRRLPDEGIYDTVAFIEAIAATGYTGPVGCEVLSIALRAQPLEEALRTAAAAARRVLNRAVKATP